MKLRILLTLCFIVVSLSIYAQEEEGKKNIKTEKVKKSKKNKQEKDAFAVPDSIGSESKYSTRIQRLIADPLTPGIHRKSMEGTYRLRSHGSFSLLLRFK